MPPDPRDAVIKEAKQYVRNIVRNDWSFESLSPQQPQQSPPPAQVLEWRLREYDSSSSELEPPTAPGSFQVVDMLSPAPVKATTTNKSGANHAVQASDGVREGREEGEGEDEDPAKLRRKRRRRMEEEMCWNEGLRTWVLRRNAWSGARTRREVHGGGRRENQKRKKSKKKKKEEGGTVMQFEASGVRETVEDTTGPVDTPKDNETRGEDAERLSVSIPSWSSSSSPSRVHLHGDDLTLVDRAAALTSMAETATTASPAQHQHQQQGNTMRKESTETAITEPDGNDIDESMKEQEEDGSDYDSDSVSDSDEEDANESLVPIVPPLLSPSNPIRSSITPSIYPSIYSKIIVQGLTPTVPINLADLTRAMVQGWKADGQWPPKPSVPAPGDNITTTRRKPTVAEASLAVGGASSGARPDSTSAQQSQDTAAAAAGGGHTRRRSSVANAVRKVLHFSGIHSHPFHRRGSTHDPANGERSGAAAGVAIVDEPAR